MTPLPKSYRWLRQGHHYRYSARPGRGDDSRRGQKCQLLTVPRGGARPGNVRVRFEDGHLAIVPAGVLKEVS